LTSCKPVTFSRTLHHGVNNWESESVSCDEEGRKEGRTWREAMITALSRSLIREWPCMQIKTTTTTDVYRCHNPNAFEWSATTPDAPPPNPLIHSNLHILSIRDFIYRLTEKVYNGCLNHPNPLISSIGNYSLSDLRYQYKKYIHKRPKHILP